MFQIAWLIFLLGLIGCGHSPPPVDTTTLAPQNVHFTNQESELRSYKNWVKEIKKISPSEKKLILDYLIYLENPKKKNTTALFKKLKSSIQKNHSPVDYEYFHLFTNQPLLIHKTQSLANLSYKHLVPLVEKGDPSALEFILIYTASSKIPPAEIELVTPLLKNIELQHNKTLSTVLEKNKDFFRLYPPLLF